MAVYSERYNEALIFAARAHRNQVRKGTDIPYIMHPFHVSLMLQRCGLGEDVAIAGLLHDVVEDCGIPLEAIEEAFGPAVARLVSDVSEEKSVAGQPLGWEARKRAQIAHLRTAGFEVAALKAADTTHNARSVATDLRHSGPNVWERFRRGPVETLWYYREILAGTRAWLGEDHPLVGELAAAIDAVASLSSDKLPVAAD